ncbi:hypothetical protein BX666DRAFT_719548 [Dichotomocladium elegans]|nr:hypothetical protein BX666DRAFT_719548 [Dichotomocladium elegans]
MCAPRMAELIATRASLLKSSLLLLAEIIDGKVVLGVFNLLDDGHYAGQNVLELKFPETPNKVKAIACHVPTILAWKNAVVEHATKAESSREAKHLE